MRGAAERRDHRPVTQGERAPAADPPPPPRAHRAGPARAGSSSRRATASASVWPTSSCGRWSAACVSRERLFADVRRHAAAQAGARGPRRDARGAGAVGLAALRAGREMTQQAIDRRLTVIAFEAMNHWTADGAFSLHVFHKNNELAGYGSVLHALHSVGLDRGLRPQADRGGHRVRGDRARCGDGPGGAGGHRRRRPHPAGASAAVASPIHSARLVPVRAGRERPERATGETATGPEPLAGYLAAHDIIVNCVLQDPNAPMMFLDTSDLPASRRGPSSSTCRATRAWASLGAVRRRSRRRS